MLRLALRWCCKIQGNISTGQNQRDATPLHPTGPLCGESTSHWWIPLTNGQLDVMASHLFCTNPLILLTITGTVSSPRYSFCVMWLSPWGSCKRGVTLVRYHWSHISFALIYRCNYTNKDYNIFGYKSHPIKIVPERLLEFKWFLSEQSLQAVCPHLI